MTSPVGGNSVETPGQPPAAAVPPGVAGLASSLRRLRASAKAQLILQRLGLIAATLLAAAVLAGLLDYWLRLPMLLRLTLWMGAVGTSLWIAFRRVAPALRFTPSLTEVALRVERSPAGRRAGLEGVLAAGLELASAREAGSLSGALAAEATAEAARRFASLPRITTFLDPRDLRRTLLALVAVGLPILGLTLAAPRHARVGWARVALPWTEAQWPKRTGVVAAAHPIAHPVNAPLPLRAVLTLSPDANAADVSAEYRVVIDGQAGPWRKALLTSQRRIVTVDQPGGAPPASGTLYERLLDAGSLTGGARGANVALEYVFRTLDDATQPWHVVLVEPPAVVAGKATITPPPYAADILGSASRFVTGERDLGPGRDERAAVGPILAGSVVTLDFTLNKDVPPPPPDGLRVWAAASLPGLDLEPTLSGAFTGRAWTVTFVAGDTLRLPVIPIDAFGIRPSEDAAYRLEVIADRPPTAAIVEPPADEAVLASAVIPLATEGRDDVALAWAALTTQVARVPANSAGAPPEAQGEPAEAARATPIDGDEATRLTLRAASVIDLSGLGLTPGDEVQVRGLATDVLGASTGATPSASEVRRLRIIGESEFIEQVRAELSGVREAAKRLATDQSRLAARREAAATDPDAASAQSAAQQALGQRLTPMGDVLRRLAERVARNRLDDKAMAGVLEDAAGHVDDAGAASDRAAASLDELARGDRPEAAADAAEAQARAEEELSALANLLDRGQDSWAVRRELEKLLTEQRQVRAQTQAAGEASRGVAADRLPQAAREDLERLARRQQDAARRADALVETLAQRARDLRAGDEAQADAMQAAANRGQREQVADLQRRAGEQIQKNQTAQADELQAQAEEAIENMLEELDKAASKQEEALRRLLADLAESIEMLIAAQERELGRLGGAAGGVIPADLDAGMIALHQNTLGVRDKAEAGARGAAKLLGLLGAAGDAQGLAVASLRDRDFAVADTHERASLAKLTEALAEARRLEEQAESRAAEEKRADLRKAYAEALDEQAGLLGAVRELPAGVLNRRQKSEARAVGERQLLLREQLSQLRSQTQDIADAVLFSFAHDRLDAAMAAAAAPLREGEAPAIVAFHQQSALRTLQALVRALTEEPKDNEFREDEGGDEGGGGGGGGGDKPPLIPPLAELRLLRAIQAEAAELTRALAEAGETPDPQQLAATARLQRDLARRAQDLLDKLNQEGGESPPADVPPPGDAPDEGETP